MSANAHFRVAGIPIRIEPIFWVVTAMIGFNLSDARLIIVWVGVVLVSVLVHELGHAIALKAYGQPSSIVLHGFGGMTLSRRREGKTQSIIVSLAGPLSAMALLGLPAYLLRESDYGQELLFGYRGGFGLWPVIVFAVWVNVWWSVANLLPIRPLDGGHVMTELIGIDKARILSVVFGAGAAVWAYTHTDAFRFGAFFAAFLAFINFSEYRRSKSGERAPSAFDIEGPAPDTRPSRGPRAAPPARRSGRPTVPPTAPSAQEAVTPLAGGVDPASAESFAWNLLRRGEAEAARQVLRRSTGPVGPFVGATVALAADGDLEPLLDAYRKNPSGPSNLVPASVAAASGSALTLARRLVDDGPGGREAAASIQTHLHYGEKYEHAAAVGEVLYTAGGNARAQTAFDVACSWAKAGDADRALQWVERAVTDGFAAPRLLDGEPDLAAARAHPGWEHVRSKLD